LRSVFLRIGYEQVILIFPAIKGHSTVYTFRPQEWKQTNRPNSWPRSLLIRIAHWRPKSKEKGKTTPNEWNKAKVWARKKHKQSKSNSQKQKAERSRANVLFVCVWPHSLHCYDFGEELTNPIHIHSTIELPEFPKPHVPPPLFAFLVSCVSATIMICGLQLPPFQI